MSVRSFAEKIARGRRIKRRLPNGIPVYLSLESRLSYLKRAFDEDLIDLASNHVTPDSVVWDVGANCGVFAFSSAVAKSIVAVEADPFLASLLQQSTSMNGVPITLVSGAASSKIGIAEFCIASRGRASNFLRSVHGRSQAGGVRSSLMVPTVTLDSLLDISPAPTLMKIDVEGAEADALAGASTILHEARPRIYLETDRETQAKCRAILSKARYSIVEVDTQNWMCTPDNVG